MLYACCILGKKISPTPESLNQIHKWRTVCRTGVTQHGCNFHYTAVVYKNIGAKGLQSLHYNFFAFQELIYMLYGLAYVLVDKVVDIYTQLLEYKFQVLMDED